MAAPVLIERVLDRQPCADLTAYVARGGGRGLDVARRLGAASTIDEVEAAGLRGRGGAGYPTGAKWRTVATMATPDHSTPVVVNAAEGEPATFKDRALLRANPYKVLEGALIAAVAIGAREVLVATKASFERELGRLRTAITEIRDAGWCEGATISLLEGPDEYLFGEETGLLEVIEGRQPFPRVTPPYRRGLDAPDDDARNPSSGVELAAAGTTEAAPVLVNNVETMANLPGLLAEGADWYRALGTAESPGTILCTMSGHCRRHAVGEVAMGTSLLAAIEHIGHGPESGGTVVGALSGVANPIVPEHLLGTPLTYEDMASIGSGLGAAGFFVIDDQTDPVAVAHGAARFLAIESCGQCEPCKRDGLAIADLLGSLAHTDGTVTSLDELESRLDTVTDGARCYLASQQERVVRGALRWFPDAFEAHRQGEAEATTELIAPIVDIVDGRAVLDTTHARKQPDWTFDEEYSGAWPATLLVDAPIDLRSPAPSRYEPSTPR
jgi:NADH-quinone oxidoreductase subunit F